MNNPLGGCVNSREQIRIFLGKKALKSRVPAAQNRYFVRLLRVLICLGQLPDALPNINLKHQTSNIKHPSCCGETDDFLFASAEGVRRRDKGDLNVFLGTGHQVATATQVELVLDVLAMTFDRFHAQV